MQRILEMDGGDGCTTLWMHLMPLNWTPKMVKMVNFVMGISLHWIKIQGGRWDWGWTHQPHESVRWQSLGQALQGVNTNYILKPHTFPSPPGPSHLVSDTQILLSLTQGCYSGHWGLSLPSQPSLLPSRRAALPRPLVWPCDLLWPMKSEQLWHFQVEALRTGVGPAVFLFLLQWATCNMPDSGWVRSKTLWCSKSLRCGAHMSLQQNWGCLDSDMATGIWVLSCGCCWPQTMNPRAGTRVRSEAFITESKM